MNQNSKIVVWTAAGLIVVATLCWAIQERHRAAAERARKAFEAERGALLRNTAGDRAELRKKAQMDARLQKFEEERRAAQIEEERQKTVRSSIEQEAGKEPKRAPEPTPPSDRGAP